MIPEDFFDPAKKICRGCERLVVRGWAKIQGVEEVVVVGLGVNDDWVFPIDIYI